MDPAAVTPEDFNFLTLFLQADWVVKLVMLGLAGASLWSWTVILDKAVRFTVLNREAEKFEEAVASGRSLEASAVACLPSVVSHPTQLSGYARSTDLRPARTRL